MKRPPSPEQWRIDAELRGGHFPGETITWAGWWMDYADEVGVQRAAPAGVISPQCEPRWLTRLRRRFGR
jgi:hypothetical protein